MAKDPSSDKQTPVEIRELYYREIERIVAQSGQFDSVADYVNFVLNEVLFGQGNDDSSEENEAVVRRRLRDLGYL